MQRAQLLPPLPLSTLVIESRHYTDPLPLTQALLKVILCYSIITFTSEVSVEGLPLRVVSANCTNVMPTTIQGAIPLYNLTLYLYKITS